MGSNSRDLRVRFIGDAGSLKSTFAEVAGSASGAAKGFDVTEASAANVGRTFTRTGKVFKSTGKLLKSSGLDAASASAGFLSTIPALSGMAGGAGGVVTQLEGLANVAGSVGPAGIAVLAASAVAAGAAFVIFRDRVGAATEALNIQRTANEELAKSHRAVGAAVTTHKETLAGLRGAQLTQRANLLGLEQANRDVAKAEKDSGKGSLEYRSALLAQQQAQEAVRNGREDINRQSVEALRTTKAATKAIDDEVVSTRAAADEARKRQQMIALGLISGKDAAAASREIKKTLNAEAKASEQSAAKHKDNAQRTRELADAVGTATPRAKKLHDRLLELSRTEVNMAAAISAMNAVRDAANSAAGGIQHVIDLLRTAASAPGPGGGGPTGGSAPDFKRLQELGRLPSNPSFGLARVPVGSSTDLARVESRGGRAADSARRRAEAAARKAGANDTDASEAGDRAFIAARKRTLNTLRTRINARRKSLLKEVKKFDINARRKVKVPGPKYPDKRQAALDRRTAMKQREETIRQELETLSVDYADAAAELRDLGEQVAALDRADEAEAAEAADAAQEKAAADAADAPTERDFLEQAAAEATFTPGLGDDINASAALVGLADRELAAARASGDPRRITAALETLRQAQANFAALTDNTAAVQANTEAIAQAFGGSTVFAYRGQDFALRSLVAPSSDRLVGAETGL